MNTAFEERRQAELDALLLDPFADTPVDDLTRLASDTFDVPMSAISIIGGERQWFKSKLGLDASSRILARGVRWNARRKVVDPRPWPQLEK